MEPIQVALLAGGVLVVVVIIIVAIVNSRRTDDALIERIERSTSEDFESFISEAEQETEIEQPQKRRKFLEGLNEILKERSFGKKWRQQLARADLKLTVAEFAVLHIVSIAAFFSAGFFVLFPGDMVFSIVGGFIGFFAPRIYVGHTISKRLHGFEGQLPDTLGLWVNALRSGYSVMQSMEAIARDAPQPTKTEFHRVVQEVQLGIDMTDALQHLLDRVESEDLDLVCTAVNIQREVGGNLAEILETISGTIRERIKLKGEIRVLTSQGRITGYLISFLPIGLAFLLNTINPGYMGPMFTNRGCGWPMLGVGLALIGIGTAVIQKIVDIEI